MSSSTAVVIGAVVGAGSALLVGLIDRWFRGREELKRAAGAYVSALDDMCFVLQQFPAEEKSESPPPKIAAKVRDLLDSMEPWFGTILGHDAAQMFSYLVTLPINRRVESVVSRLAEAQNRFLLLAPSYLQPMLIEAHGVTVRWSETRDPALREEWLASRPGIVKVVGEALRLPWTRLSLRAGRLINRRTLAIRRRLS